jgi:hypothetical protein
MAQQLCHVKFQNFTQSLQSALLRCKNKEEYEKKKKKKEERKTAVQYISADPAKQRTGRTTRTCDRPTISERVKRIK